MPRIEGKGRRGRPQEDLGRVRQKKYFMRILRLQNGIACEIMELEMSFKGYCDQGHKSVTKKDPEMSEQLCEKSHLLNSVTSYVK